MNQWVAHPVSLRDRFYQKVIPVTESGCWIWVGGTGGGGRYGAIHRGKNFIPRMVTAHRISWELHVGQIPSGMEVCHKCDVGFCVNPAHLFLGTHKDNCDDRDRKGRNVAHKGENHWAAKLSPEDVLKIRSTKPYTRGVAKAFGITESAVCAIRKGRTWSHL